jgi:type II secretory pathway component GspD/PulD (secretin)
MRVKIKKKMRTARLFRTGVLVLSGVLTFGVGLRADGDVRRYAAADLPLAAAGITVPASTDPQHISLDLRDMEIAEALKFLASKAGLNIIPTKNIAGRVTLMVENVPLQDVFDLMIRSNNLAYEKKGNIFNVMTEDEYKAFFGKNFSDIRQVRVFHLRYAIPEQVFNILDSFKSSIGKIFVEPETGTVMIMDAPERMQEIEKAMAALEQKTTIRIFDMKYAKAKDVEEQLKSQLDIKKVGSIKADDRTNRLIVQTLPERMDDIERLLKGLDQKTRQVLVDARIIKIRLANDTSRGVEWEGLFDMGKKLGLTYLGSTPFSVINPATTSGTFTSRKEALETLKTTVGTMGSYPFSGTTSNLSSSVKDVGMGSLHLGAIGRNDFDVLIKYLQTIGKTKILSCPQIAVINNQEAKIHVGERQAYVTTSTTAGQTTTTVSESVTYVDVGLQMSVTPTINDEGYVTMKIKPEISSVVDVIVSSSNNRIPIIDTATAETSVMVKDGTTIMIGGLNKEEESEDYQGTPFLGKLPLLGFFFSTKTKSKVRTEILILLTPHIIAGDELTTGYERDFGAKIDKSYEPYKPITEGSDLSPEPAAVKPYQDYAPMLNDEEDYQLVLKPLRDA